MMLPAGTRIGWYEVLSAIGAGGMGEVYRARDLKLDREVALKVLPDAFASDRERLIRFEREARALAALNHPNIAHIHGIEDSGAVRALVMEFVEGEDLAARLQRGALPLDEALAAARQIAEALEAAHERGIIHRDLKPANIKVTADGTVKVLDFGLARALSDSGSGTGTSAESAANSPTFTSPMTQMGVILGTAAYMAPEQAKGKPVDRRADIWALGVVLFEMVAGRHLYEGETATETIAQIITQPPRLDLVPATTSAGVRRILRRCLQKDPRQRYQSAGDVRIEIDEVLAGRADTGAIADLAGSSRRTSRSPWILTAVFAIIAAAALWRASSRPEQIAVPMRLDVRLGGGEQLLVDDNLDGALAVLSPDGQTLVFAGTRGGVRQLFVRPLSGLESTPLSDTAGARAPFFSPDGRWVAFFALGKLRKVNVGGGGAIDICPATDARGGAWGPDGTIVFTPGTQDGLVKVPASGGTPATVTQVAAGERSHRWPQFLPGGNAVLFMRQDQGAAYDDGFIETVRLDTNERKVIVRGGTFPAFVRGGYLLYLRENTVFSIPFDPESLEVRGEARPVLSKVLASGGVGEGAGNGGGQFAVSASGTAVYIAGQSASPLSRVVVLDREGKRVYTSTEVRDFRDPRFSPDGMRLAVAVGSERGQHIYVIDLARSTTSRVTFDGNMNGLPVWTPDAKRLAYVSDRANTGINVFVTKADGGGEPVALTTGSGRNLPTSFSPDGKLLAVMRLGPTGNLDTQLLSLDTGEFLPFGESTTDEIAAMFSPDGRWIAYGEGVGAASDVYVRPYSRPGGRWQISSGGGGLPAWTKGGREIVWVAGFGTTRVMVADVTADGDSIKAGPPSKLFEIELVRPSNATWFHASPDGTRFAALIAGEGSLSRSLDHVTLILNFAAEVHRK
jgi:Tol biopolymer transport system component